MTQNQLGLLNLQETRRNNIVVSNEQGRHNLATEAESGRHNLVTESQTSKTIKETKRHDIATEKLSNKQIATQAKSAKYSADSSKAASKYAADSSRAASKYSADSNAAVQKYAAELNAANAKLRAWTDDLISQRSSVTSRDIARFNGLVNTEIKKMDNDMRRMEAYLKDKQVTKQLKVQNKKIKAEFETARRNRDANKIIAIMNNYTKLASTVLQRIVPNIGIGG